MYLSRLILNPRTRRVQKELANPYELHRTLMRAFSETLPAGERVLFRVETDPRTGVPTVLLQSCTEPSWQWLEDEGARGYLIGLPQTKSFELRLAAEQVLAFRLRANPTVKHKAEGKRNGQRAALYKEEDQIAWLQRKAVEGGFVVLSARTVDEGKSAGLQANDDGPRRKLTMLAVRFEGLLRVVDPDALRQTVRQGIGPGKGLGFGLLSLARAKM